MRAGRDHPINGRLLLVGRCGDSDGCLCAVQQGAGITVTGDGSVESPYVVSVSGAAATAFGAVDTDTVDFTLTGAGTVGDPYVLTAVVPDGTVVPDENATLDMVGAKVGAGLDFDAGTRVTSLLISADPNNAAALGSDSGVFVPEPATAVISGDVGNELVEGTDDGLFVPPVDPADLISADADNVLVEGTDGKLYAPEAAGGAISADTPNALIPGTDAGLYVPPIVSAMAGNAISEGPGGSAYMQSPGWLNVTIASVVDAVAGQYTIDVPVVGWTGVAAQAVDGQTFTLGQTDVVALWPGMNTTDYLLIGALP